MACADLKPISQKELQNVSKSERRTNLTYQQKPREAFGRSLHLKTLPADLDAAPATSASFCRNWRRYLPTNAEKLRYVGKRRVWIRR